MLKMSESSRRFLEKNCPEVLEAKTRREALWCLFDSIEEKGFGGEHFDEYNEYGEAAQIVYDEICNLNPKE